jgi:hypothetical protein
MRHFVPEVAHGTAVTLCRPFSISLTLAAITFFLQGIPLEDMAKCRIPSKSNF